MFDDLIKEKPKFENTVRNICVNCGKIVMSWYHGSGVTCSDECRKKFDEKFQKKSAQVNLIKIGKTFKIKARLHIE